MKKPESMLCSANNALDILVSVEGVTSLLADMLCGSGVILEEKSLLGLHAIVLDIHSSVAYARHKLEEKQ